MVIRQSKAYMAMLKKRYMQVYHRQGLVWANQWARAHVPEAMHEEFLTTVKRLVKYNPRDLPPVPIEPA